MTSPQASYAILPSDATVQFGPVLYLICRTLNRTKGLVQAKFRTSNPGPVQNHVVLLTARLGAVS
jgi:hypothetical protein